jgi:asparagine synthase (glutamine-hydrolysing)
MKEASEHIKIILDGQGADELFCGYIPMIRSYIIELWQSKKIMKRMYAARLLIYMFFFWGNRFLPVFKDGISSITKKLFIANSGGKESQFTKTFDERTQGVKRPAFKSMLKSPLNDLCYEMIAEKSLPALLRYEDRTCMAFSIEARVPILDYRLVEFALVLPAEYKVRGACRTKWILRNLNDKLLPKSVAWRRSKLGYPTPFSRWLKSGGSVDDLKSVTEQFKLRNIVRPEVIEKQYQNHISGKADNSWILYRYITLEIWYQIFIDGFIPHYAKKVKEIDNAI